MIFDKLLCLTWGEVQGVGKYNRKYLKSQVLFKTMSNASIMGIKNR